MPTDHTKNGFGPLLSFAAARADFAAGRDTPRTYLERCVERIAATEPELRAFVSLDLVQAREAADAAVRRYYDGQSLSAIDGMPVGVKDLFETVGSPTTMGSPIFREWRSGRDAAAVAALRHAGAVIVGKTVTTEFAVGRAGPTRNPHGLGRTPGGSSSGSAACVGGGILPGAIGTQTQSSTIRPASYCGAYAFKPTHGTVHLGGVHPLAPSMDHFGAFAGSVADGWSIVRSVAVRSGGEPSHSALAGGEAVAPARPATLARLDTAGWESLSASVRDAFEAFIDQLRSAGISVLSRRDNEAAARLEDLLTEADRVSEEILAYEMCWPFDEYIRRHPGLVGDRVRELVERGRRIGLEDYARHCDFRDRLRRVLSALRGACDGIVTLSASGPAPKGLEGERPGPRTYAVPASLTGAPAWSLPLLRVDGLPLGIQLIGFLGGDESLTACARAIDDMNWERRVL